MFKPLNTRALLSAAVLALASLHASATLVTSRGALVATGSLDWVQLGVDGATVAAPANANTSISGLSASVTNPGGGGGGFTRFNEGGGTWTGDFALGDALLTTFGSGGSIKIDFSTGVSRVGAQIQGIDFASFDGVIEVYDVLNQLLESHTVNDLAVFGNADNSAMFLGISRTAADIDSVIFNITGATNPDFGINLLSLSQQVTRTQPGVPEPGSMALVALSLAGLGLVSLVGRRTKR